MRLENRIAATSEVVTSSVGDELVLLDLQRGIYYGLNPAGVRIWQLLAGGLSIGETIERLAGEHDAPREELERDVVRIVEELQERQLIVVTTGGSS